MARCAAPLAVDPLQLGRARIVSKGEGDTRDDDRGSERQTGGANHGEQRMLVASRTAEMWVAFVSVVDRRGRLVEQKSEARHALSINRRRAPRAARAASPRNFIAPRRAPIIELRLRPPPSWHNTDSTNHTWSLSTLTARTPHQHVTHTPLITYSTLLTILSFLLPSSPPSFQRPAQLSLFSH